LLKSRSTTTSQLLPSLVVNDQEGERSTNPVQLIANPFFSSLTRLSLSLDSSHAQINPPRVVPVGPKPNIESL
jgi:hypothetical protein